MCVSHFRSPGFYPLLCWQGIVQHPFHPTWGWEIEEEGKSWTISEHPPSSSIPSRAKTPSAQLEEVEEEDVSPEQATNRVIQQHLRGRAEWVQDRAKQLRFLHAVSSLCYSAQRQRWDTLEPQFSKAALMESIASQDAAAEADAEEEGRAGGSRASGEQRPTCSRGERPLCPRWQGRGQWPGEEEELPGFLEEEEDTSSHNRP
ncbi:unnamed protein product [Caretta caretta]